MKKFLKFSFVLKKDLFQKLPTVFSKPIFNEMLEFKWANWLEDKKKELKGETWHFDDVVMVFVDNSLLGGTNAFIQWAVDNYNFEDFRNNDLYEIHKNEAYANFLESTNVI